jgi:hypothetical protein
LVRSIKKSGNLFVFGKSASLKASMAAHSSSVRRGHDEKKCNAFGP